VVDGDRLMGHCLRARVCSTVDRLPWLMSDSGTSFRDRRVKPGTTQSKRRSGWHLRAV
jgi:hypothetical protein